jgi:hypothetical protein
VGSGQLGLQTGPGGAPKASPKIDTTYQSTTTVDRNGTVTLQASAHDPQGGALTFAWVATSGNLGAASSTAGATSVTWTAPACIAAGVTPTITLGVTDAVGLSATRSFLVAPTPAAVCP